MSKNLSDMSLEELWQLFPVVLTQHNDAWVEWYTEETTILNRILDNVKIERISHIGSTAIKGIWAKPTVDILVEISQGYNINKVKELLVHNGYTCMSKYENRMSFNKGYTVNGFAEKVFHLHLRLNGDNDELYFRDFLNDNPIVASQYEELKLILWKEYEHDRDGYTEVKGTFISEYTQRAKKVYGNRYV